MKKLFLLFLPCFALAWLASLSSCHKCKGVKGQVLEFGTETPIPDATVKLIDCEDDGSLSGNLNCTEIARTATGQDGRFGFGQDGFSVSAEAAGYWDTGDDFELVVNECPSPVLHLSPHAWIQIKIKNESGAYEFGHGNNLILNMQAGQDTVITEISKGNTDFKFGFFILESPTDITQTTLEDLQNVKIMDDSGNIISPSLVGSFDPWFKTYLPGHQTTKVTITY